MAHIQTSEPESHVPEEVENFQKAADDLNLLVKPHDLGIISEEDIDLNKQINAKEITSPVTSKPFERKGSSNVPNQQMISYGSDVHKGSKPDTCEISDQVISTSRDTVCITPDSITYTSSISDQVVSYQSYSTVASSENLNIEKPFPQNQSMQIVNFLGEKGNLNFTESTAYNMNDSEQENKEGKIADSQDFKDKGLFSVGSTDAASEDINQSKSCTEKIENGSKLKVQTIELEHLKSESMNFEMSNTTDFHCAVSNVVYSERSSHDGNKTCNACKKIFDCKVKLEDHYLTHEKLHETICRICHFEISKHKTIKEKIQYQCCECSYIFASKSSLKQHLYIHSPLKLFKCELCGLRFKQSPCARTHWKKMHPLCVICGKRFVDNNSLVEHRLEQH